MWTSQFRTSRYCPRTKSNSNVNVDSHLMPAPASIAPRFLVRRYAPDSLTQFEKRRRRWLIPAQGSSVARSLGHKRRLQQTLKALGLCANNPFRVGVESVNQTPGFSLHSNPGLELANAFGVFQTEPQRPVSERVRRFSN
jgi:hypothetical protein